VQPAAVLLGEKAAKAAEEETFMIPKRGDVAPCGLGLDDFLRSLAAEPAK